MSDKLQAELELYKSLRQEIANSIKLQHATFFSGSLVISLVFSLGLRLLPNNPQTTSGDWFYYVGNILIMSLPPITIAFSAMWLIEQSRLMRAGDYLKFLEDKINKELGEPCITWENWLRCDDSSMLNIHRIHHVAQYIIMIIFFSIGIVAIILIQSLNVPEKIRAGLTIIYIISIPSPFR